MVRQVLCFLVVAAVCVGCKDKTDKNWSEATITGVDAKKGTVAVRMQRDGKEVEKTFKLAEDVEYADSTGEVADSEIFTSGDLVLIVEREGTVSRIKKKAAGGATKKSAATNKTEKETKTADGSFIRGADQTNLTEVKLGKIAAEHASSDAVKQFGERMVRDHAKMNKDLREITGKKGLASVEKLDQPHQDLVDQLSKLRGDAFDLAYTKDMVSGHEKALTRFEDEAKNGEDPEVKAWAEKYLPTIREHLTAARATVKDVKGK